MGISFRVGITIGLHAPNESLWSNGIKQNAVFLAETLKHVPSVCKVTLVNMTHVPITEALPWDLQRWPTVGFQEVKDDLDVLIELGGQVSEDQTDYLKSRGVHLVSYCCATEYVMAMETILFRKGGWGGSIFINQRYDDIWMVPQIADTSRPYLEVMRRIEGRVIPFVWDPVFLNEQTMQCPNQGVYQARNSPARVTIMEPNINVVKFCLYPVMLTELVYRTRPDILGYVHVVNAEGLAKDSPEFASLMFKLDLVKDSKIAFVARHGTPQFLSEMTDIVVSHQWGNPLNYFYLEVAWMGYPLVHNAHLCKDLGYYYPENDLKTGAARMIEALDNHNANKDEYLSQQRRIIERYLPSNKQVIATYDELLRELKRRPLR